MQQGDREWHAFRKAGIGSSDAPIVMGVSPYRTPFQLWQEKVGLIPPPQSTYIMEWGKQLEPFARSHYEQKFNRQMKPATFVHDAFPILRASLDGAQIDQKLGLEIKCSGKETFLNALLSKKIPMHHWVQVQHQLFVTGFERCDYYVFYAGSGVLVEVLPDIPYQVKLVLECLEFWKRVETKIPPPFLKKDLRRFQKVLKEQS